ncbi:MAG: phosphoribosylformylglycinamidine synthase subunit PurQ [Thermoguttaceae bacterium]
MKSHVLILRAPGTNCDQETAFAFEKAGASSVTILHINRILEQPNLLDPASILCFPGGFSFGDDVAAGKVFAVKMTTYLSDALRQFRDAGKLILGICNGFQVLLKSGLIFEPDDNGAVATLTWNSIPKYTDQWTQLKTKPSDCVFLRGISSMYLPIAHAEGRFVPRSDAEMIALQNAGQLPLRYESNNNPNGSVLDIAGACDQTGRVFGLMPHPERHIDAIQHPHWTRRHFSESLRQTIPDGDGFGIFQNAVSFFN